VAQASTAPLSAPSPVSQPSHVITGYCVYEKRANREIRDPHRIVLKNGQTAIGGVCASCGKPIFRGLVVRPISPTGVVTTICTNRACAHFAKQVELRDPRRITLQNGQPAFEGACPYCGVHTFIVDQKVPEDQAEFEAGSGGPATASVATPVVAASRPLLAGCMHCHALREIVNPEKIVQGRRPPWFSGTCAVCGGRLGRLVRWSVGPTGAVITYCSKCLKEVEVRKPKMVTRPRWKDKLMEGTCSSCGMTLTVAGDEPDEGHWPPSH